MTYAEAIEERYQLSLRMAEVERFLLKYNGATLFVEKKKRRATKKVTPATQLPVDWWPSNDLLIKAKENYPNVEVGTETEKFMNYYMSRGKPMKNWDSAWKNWIITSNQYQEARQ